MARQRPRRRIIEEQPSATIQLPPVAKKSKRGEEMCQMWDFALIVSVAVTAAAYMFLYVYMNPSVERLPPLPAVEHDPNLWGTYRPQLYFGLKTRSANSPVFGMMWYEQPPAVFRPNLRHWCNQDDRLEGYSWYEADGRTFGRQNITEKTGTIETEWLNHQNGGFSARVRLHMQPGRRFNVIFYMVSSTTDQFSKFSLGKRWHDTFVWNDPVNGKKLRFSVQNSKEKVTRQSAILTEKQVALEEIDRFIMENTKVYEEPAKPIFYLLNNKENNKDGKFVAVQYNLGNEAELNIALTPSDNLSIEPEVFEKELAKRSAHFNKKFESIFELKNKNYTNIQLKMAKTALSNMLGSIGFWYGFNKVTVGTQTQLYGPHQLLSAVPSRPFFPRGFLWDEGFHNMLIRKFDPKLSIEIMTSWLNVMDTSGWIPREMIIGAEAEAKVPAEYINQKPDLANPPVFFYVMEKLVQDERITKHQHTALKGIYGRLEKWFIWLRTTQTGPSKTTFRWRGRNETILTELNPKTMASGMDDYPRASHPSSDEYHLDLRCWLAMSGRVLERLSKILSTDAEHRKYAKHMEELNDFESMVQEHWSEEHGGFFDYGKHSEDMALAPVPTPTHQRHYEYQRVTSRAPTNKLVTDVFGYNSLYPLIFKLVPANSRYLKETLDKIRDPKILWTNFGLRSLSKSSPYYQTRNTEHDPPYWRGFIWININYMTLSALKHYSNIPGPYQELCNQIFVELRGNLVENMGKQFEKTGYIWENYDDKTGEGRGSHPFNGWSSLILMIMSDNLDT